MEGNKPQRVDSDFTNAPHTDPKEPSIDQFDVIDIDRGLFRRDVEVTQTVTAVVATAIDVIIESGSQTIAQVTVTSLPAVVSVPALGVITIPADSKTPTAVVAAAATAGPEQQIPLGSSATLLYINLITYQRCIGHFYPIRYIILVFIIINDYRITYIFRTFDHIILFNILNYKFLIDNLLGRIINRFFCYFFFQFRTFNDQRYPISVIHFNHISSQFIRRKHAQTAAGATEGPSRDIQGGSGPRSAEMMSQRSSNTPLAAAAVLGRWASSSSRRSGRQENPFMAPGERGFQKISGRKIPSVLHTGGDGYGDEIEEEAIPELRTPPLEATSPVSPVSAIGGGSHRHAPMRDDFIAAGVGAGAFVLRPSPARTPTASSVDLTAQSQSGQYGTSPMRPDPLGRTLSRHDGSRSSRFTEGI
ncbi:hypothetical protein TCE0_034f10627 [Talaromyces pinophilus]|uniref:Uncharacterized protein n=1 Tax=Talaromyces pinophilus TaxID=128442 RepID=A0A6V8HL73_TALPI|nr:hypothetical protein TCE0_034f10627 [Talaromyces pinophilus]